MASPARRVTAVCGKQLVLAHDDVAWRTSQTVLDGFKALHASLDRDDLDRVSREQRIASSQRYIQRNEAWIGGPLGDRFLLDKNPGATLLLPVFLRLFPRFKTLIALRDPRDVILSCFFLHLPLNPLSVHFLTLERVARRCALDLGAWVRLREQWPAPWLEVRYEDTVADLPAQASRVLAFLGLPWNEAVSAPHQHARKHTVHSPTYAQVAQPVHRSRVGRWRAYADYLEPVLPILEPVMKSLGYAFA